MSSHGDEHPAIAFLKLLFGHTTESVYLCSLPNEKGDSSQAPERAVCDRDVEVFTTFLNRWDRDGRGCYFSLATFKPGARRQKPNAIETPSLPIDIDFKSLLDDERTVDRALAECRCPPSLIVHSGHGRHPYWILKEALPTQEYLDRIEAVMRQLADVFAADLAPAHAVALMRLPGTHNTKGGQSWEVTVTEDTGRRYELDELEEWLSEQSPKLRRKVRPKPPDNPYLAVADLLGFKPPLDVEQRLTAMVYQGPGEAAIHDTQRAVTASLISRGTELDQVVKMVLDATRVAAGEYGMRWNWAREETSIRKMCMTWRTKIGEKREDRVVNLAQARGSRAKPQAEPEAARLVSGKKFHAIAQATIAGIRARDEDLLFENEQAWRYKGGMWHPVDAGRKWLDIEIERACQALTMPSDNRLISEARKWIERSPDLNRTNVPWDQHGMVPTVSGLVDPNTGELQPARPEHYATWRVACAYDLNAKCPTWLTMLDEIFADRGPETRAATIALLQEILGAALIDQKSRGLRKALVLYGGPNAGKSELLFVFGGLFEQHIAVALSLVATPHGLMPFLVRRPWILHEAFDQSVWHLSGAVKSLITGEEIGVNVKNGPMLARRYLGPIFWATNHAPQFKESTKAMIDRMVVVDCRQKFTHHGTGPSAIVLAHEKPGVLTWALQGLRRALDRKAIMASPESEAAGAQIYRDSNLVAGFVEECVEYDRNGRISIPDFCVAVTCWFVENRGENRSVPSNDMIGRALAALHDPRLVTDRYELRDGSARYLIGAMLNKQGLDYHEHGVTADLFEGKTVNTTMSGGLVNKPIPASWDVKPKVVAMRAAHDQLAEKSKKLVSFEIDGSSDIAPGVTDPVSSPHPPDPSSDPLF